MFPVFFRLGPLTIHTYGLLVAAGFVLGVAWSVREARRAGIDRDPILDLAFYLVIAALIGSRLMFVILRWDYFQDHPLDAFKPWTGGLVFYGGLLAAILAFIVIVPGRKMPFWLTADAFAPGLALGQALGRLGCLAAGCCYGRPSDLPWALTFTDPECLAPLGLPLHPTQLYTALALLAVFGLLILVRRHRRFPGQVFWMYALLHGLVRFHVEFLRGDFRGHGPIPGLTSTQVVALALVLAAIVMLGILGRFLRPPEERP
ncbi:MAG: prolipoprotein diacylglyceryl transferase [Proteobacteria bacterium]|nr:prolipoprotein diacylglyceryl transferase [Pseudomonadota bacterium]